MSFPNHDKHWTQTTDFIISHICDKEKLIAPVEFKEFLGEKVINYSDQYVDDPNICWAVFHKGRLEEVDIKTLKYVHEFFIPVYANEVFVIFSNHKDLLEMSNTSQHIKSYWEKVKRRRFELKIKVVTAFKNLFVMKIIEFPKKLKIKVVTAFKNLFVMKIIETKIIHRECIYLGDYRALSRTIFGHKIFVDTRDISLTPHILLDGYWEMWVTNVFMNLVKDGMNIIEIGTNIGYYSLIFSSKIGKSGKLFAFEANPQIFEMLHQTIEINGFLDRVELVNKAATDSSGKISFNILKRHHGSGSITSFSDEHLERSREEVETINVDTISLDEYFNDRDIKIDVIKIDAEGSEPYILDGMRKLINDNHDIIIICEFNPALIYGAKRDPRKFLDQIEQYGFSLRYIDDNSNIVNISIDKLMEKDICDLYLKR